MTRGRSVAHRPALRADARQAVSQHLKQIYRKLEVDSRVALTRLLLGVPASVRGT